jgi:2-polyprenyl-3-methyl-5-hydroxy-6-metoxy-1,4-benzoquinol methylase
MPSPLLSQKGIEMTDASEKNLKEFYDQSYSLGEEKVFTFLGDLLAEEIKYASSQYDLSHCRVLEVGCGSGRFAAEIANNEGIEYLGIDFSKIAIQLSNDKKLGANFRFQERNLFDLDEKIGWDFIFAFGVLEHTTEPLDALKKLRILSKPAGKIILAVPNFLNPRGIIWMTLTTLFDVPMSLSDKHFIHPWDMQTWSEAARLFCRRLTTVDKDWAFGDKLLRDFRKRIPAALTDAGMYDQSKVEDFFPYLDELVSHISSNQDEDQTLEGATALYELSINV